MTNDLTQGWISAPDTIRREQKSFDVSSMPQIRLWSQSKI